jgi:quercetin dioxygenase-like cupin family protein
VTLSELDRSRCSRSSSHRRTRETRKRSRRLLHRPSRPPVFTHDLPNVTLDDWEVTVSHVDYAPGRVGAPHKHAGFVLAYVLEGAVVAKISGQGEAKTYTVGQMFYEQPGATHEVSSNASQTQPAKLLAMIFAKKGSTLAHDGCDTSSRLARSARFVPQSTTNPIWLQPFPIPSRRRP